MISFSSVLRNAAHEIKIIANSMLNMKSNSDRIFIAIAILIAIFTVIVMVPVIVRVPAIVRMMVVLSTESPHDKVNLVQFFQTFLHF